MPLACWKELCLDLAGHAATSSEAALWAAALGLRVEPHPRDPAGPVRLVGE